MKTLKEMLKKCPQLHKVLVVYKNERILVDEVQLRFIQLLVKRGELSSEDLYIKDPRKKSGIISFKENGLLDSELKSNTLNLSANLAIELICRE